MENGPVDLAGPAIITPPAVDGPVAWLRQMIEDQADSPKHIFTARGERYRFVKS